VVRELEREVFAGELHSSRTPAPRSRPRLVRAAVSTGAIAGTLPGAAVFAIYFVMNHATPMPWIRVATVLAVFAPIAGMMLATSIQLAVLGFDRLAQVGRGARVIANAAVAGGLGGAIAGVAPGAVGVLVFGSYHGPFVGTALIAFAVIGGSVMIAVPLALRARRAGAPAHPDDRRTVALATAIATLILLAVAAVIAPILVDGAFARARGALATQGATVGSVTGAIGGAVVGLYIGMVIGLGRSLRRRATATQGD